jgi:hypothetical protein
MTSLVTGYFHFHYMFLVQYKQHSSRIFIIAAQFINISLKEIISNMSSRIQFHVQVHIINKYELLLSITF